MADNKKTKEVAKKKKPQDAADVHKLKKSLESANRVNKGEEVLQSKLDKERAKKKNGYKTGGKVTTPKKKK